MNNLWNYLIKISKISHSKCKFIFYKKIFYRNNFIAKNLQLFSSFLNSPKHKGEDDEIKKDEINNNNKYVSAFLFSTFKLIEKVRNIFNNIFRFYLVKWNI